MANPFPPMTERALKIVPLLTRSVREFLPEKPFVLAAALSYYTLLSIAPLVLVAMWMLSVFLGERAASGELVSLSNTLSPEAAELTKLALANAHSNSGGIVSAVVGIIGLLVGSTTAFAQLQGALNQIWGLVPPERPLLGTLKVRARSFLLVILMGAAVLALVIASSLLSALQANPILGHLSFAWRLVDLSIPLLMMTGLFAALFRWLPDARIPLRDVWIGAAMTSGLFVVGRYAIGLYIGRAGVGSAYGAAGTLVVVMVWTFYSALIVLFGAQLTRTYVTMQGKPVVPIRGATSSAPEPAAKTEPENPQPTTKPDAR